MKPNKKPLKKYSEWNNPEPGYGYGWQEYKRYLHDNGALSPELWHTVETKPQQKSGHWQDEKG